MRPAICCLAALVASPAFAQGTLTGRVRDPAGLGVAGAEVRIVGGAGSPGSPGSAGGAISDAGGAFHFPPLPAGTVSLAVRRIGFRPDTMTVVVRDGQSVAVVITLALAPLQLDAVMVTARREPFDTRLAGFRQRSLKRVGTFITRERIEASSSSNFSDLLRGVPGVRFGTSPSGIRNAVRFRGADCAPVVFIDGFPASAGEFDIDIIDPASVEGVEIYMGMLTAPAELTAPRGLEHCGVIAVWSRPFRGRAKPKKTVSQAELQRMVDSSALFTANQVDTPARIERESYSPVYPDSLWRKGTGGLVTVEFVVDSYGRVDMAFFSVISASHAEFGESVREALTRVRFAPAIKGGRRVRQVVHLPTRFDRPKQ